MSYDSYRARLNVNGGNIQDSTKKITKQSQVQQILSSPTLKKVILNGDNLNLLPCLISDVDTYEIRKILFLPDVKVYKGDYIGHEGFTYLVTNHTTSEEYPQAICQLCNYDFPIGKVEIKTDIIKSHLPNGQPIYETISQLITKPCVMTSKIYSTADNSSVPLADGAVTVYLPYSETDELPNRNDGIKIWDSQYKVVDFIYSNVIKFDDTYKGYVEIRLQREVNT